MSQSLVKLTEIGFDNGNSGATATIDWTNGRQQRLKLTSNCLIQLSNPPLETYLYLFLKQDIFGGNTPIFPSYVRFVNGAIPTSLPAYYSQVYRFYWNGVNYLCDFVSNFNETIAFNLSSQAIIDPSTKNGWVWGAGANGLGDSTFLYAQSPISIARSFSVIQSQDYSTPSFLGIDSSTGMVYAWGSGPLGNNTNNTSNIPVTISRSTSYSSIGLGSVTSFAIDAATGMIWGWGANTLGQIGNNTTSNVISPVTISRSASYQTVVSGTQKSAAIDAATGMIWVWGDNNSGTIGNNTATAAYSSPVTIARSASYSKIALNSLGAFGSGYAIDAATGMIWAWGYNSAGQLGNNSTTPTSSPVTIARSASYREIAANKTSDSLAGSAYAIDAATGMVWAWGNNSNGELGNNSLTSTSSPVTIARSARYIQVAAGAKTGFALDTNGVVWAWGTRGVAGALGDNHPIAAISPVTISRSTSYTGIAMGTNSGFAILGGTNSIFAWGNNVSGALGNSSGTNTSSPVTISRSTSYNAVAAGSGTGYAIDAATGNIWVWGNNASGQLGTNSANTNSPMTIARSVSYSQISGTSSATSSSGAIDAATGMIWVWGNNGSGQLGTNNSGNVNSSPVTIARSASYRSVVIGETSYAIDASTGMIWAWGAQNNAVMGNNTTTASSSPVTIARSASYSAIAGSNNHALAIDGATGMVWSWGNSANGGLGNNTSSGVDASSPVTIARSTSYSAIAAGTVYGWGSICFAIDAATKMIWGWGAGQNGCLGNNTTNFVSSPVTIARSTSYTSVTIGGSSTASVAAIDAATGMIWVWGDNSGAMLGNNTLTNYSSPVTIARSASYSQVVFGNKHALAIDGATGMVWAWGNNSFGQLGDGTYTTRSSPVLIARSASYSKIGIAANQSFAIDAATGMIYAWGSNTNFVLGINASPVLTNASPVTIARSTSYSAIAAGADSAYAIDAATGMVWAWGSNFNGALGNNSSAPLALSPVTIARSASYSKIAIGRTSVASATNGYAIDAATGMIWAWGNNTSGQLGNNSVTSTSSPVTIARSTSYSAIAAGSDSAFGIQASTGMIWAWGLNSSGQLGNNSTTSTSSPVTIARSASYSAVAAGLNAAYAIDAATGMIWAWGVGTSGELGNNNFTNISSPVTIARSASYVSIAAIATSQRVFALDGATGAVYSWGYDNNTGGLGNVDYAYPNIASSPVSVARLFPMPSDTW